MNKDINYRLLNEFRLYALEKTGCDIELQMKPFDCSWDLPENFDINDDGDLSTLIDKNEFGLNIYLETLKVDIHAFLNNDVCHASVSKIAELIIEYTVVCDETCSLWFYCNVKNTWTTAKHHLFKKVY